MRERTSVRRRGARAELQLREAAPLVPRLVSQAPAHPGRQAARGSVHAPGSSPAGTYGEWFEGGYDKQAPEGLGSLRFFLSQDILAKSDTPLAALHQFLAQREAEAKAGDDNGQMSLW